jgi:hypothetical protein
VQREHGEDPCVAFGPAVADPPPGGDHEGVPTQDPYEQMEPEDFEPITRSPWLRMAALACLIAALLLIVVSI